MIRLLPCLAVSLALSSAGCLQPLTDRLDSMNAELLRVNSQLADTNAQLDKANARLEKIEASLRGMNGRE